VRIAPDVFCFWGKEITGNYGKFSCATSVYFNFYSSSIYVIKNSPNFPQFLSKTQKKHLTLSVALTQIGH